MNDMCIIFSGVRVAKVPPSNFLIRVINLCIFSVLVIRLNSKFNPSFSQLLGPPLIFSIVWLLNYYYFVLNVVRWLRIKMRTSNLWEWILNFSFPLHLWSIGWYWKVSFMGTSIYGKNGAFCCWKIIYRYDLINLIHTEVATDLNL